jgi:DNA-binding transcriptional MerR regulator/methylmalonyl-CoA mutase cobalamin-binding subunit
MYSIGAVAQQSGIDVSTLRKWESRYGFPVPRRTASGLRMYSAEDLAAILEIARRLACGARPGAVIREIVARQGTPAPVALPAVQIDPLQPGVDALLQRDVAALRTWLDEQARQFAAVDFVEQVAAPLARRVGDFWSNGQLPVFSEHLFSSLLEQSLVLRFAQIRPVQRRCRVLLTAPSGELHVAGLSMAAAVLNELGADVIRLPSDLPIQEIVAAAEAYDVAAVGLTASSFYAPRLLKSSMISLRRQLPGRFALWLGGVGMAQLPVLPPATQLITCMPQLVASYAALVDRHHSPAG